MPPEETQSAPVVKPALPPKPFTPTATAISQRPPERFQADINDFKPDGNIHPVRLAAVKAALQILVDDLAKDADNLSAKIETAGTANGHQILIQLIKHKF